MQLGEQLELFVREAWAGNLTEKDLVRAVRREYIVQALGQHRYNRSRTARAMGWHRNTLLRNIVELGIDVAALQQASRKPAGRVGVEDGQHVRVS